MTLAKGILSEMRKLLIKIKRNYRETGQYKKEEVFKIFLQHFY